MSIEHGHFYYDSGLVKPGEVIATRMMLPLIPYAAALGYELRKDKQSGEAMLVRDDYQWVVTPGEHTLSVCGTPYEDIRVEIGREGEFRVSLSVIAMLIAERYGEDMARYLSEMLTRGPA